MKIRLIVQFAKFGIVGVLNTFISFITYYLLIFVGINYLVAHVMSFVTGVLNAYFWNNKYVFRKSDSSTMKSLIKVFISYGLTFVVSTGTLFAMVHFLGISSLLAPIFNLIITVPINFILNKYWAFR